MPKGCQTVLDGLLSWSECAKNCWQDLLLRIIATGGQGANFGMSKMENLHLSFAKK